MNTVHNINAQHNSRVHVGNVVASESRSLAALYITDPRLDKERLEKTKGGLLRGSYKWILEHEAFTRWRSSKRACKPLWIRGDPGKGKTMLLCGIIKELQQTTNLTFFFFCEASDSSRSNATAVLRGFIWLLVKKVPSLDAYLRESYDDAGKPLFEDKNAWFALSKILANILKDGQLKGAYFIIDALDECTVERHSLLHLISTQASTTETKWLVSSRNEVDIERHLGNRPPHGSGAGDIDGQSQISLEHAENATYISNAVASYINSSVQSLDCLKDDPDLSSRVRTHLQNHAQGTFLWIHLVIQQLRYENSWNVEQALEEMPDGLDKLYDRMLARIRDLERDSKLCLQLLSTVNLAQRPMHILELGLLSGIPKHISRNIHSIKTLIRMCGSFLTIKDEQVFIIHQSAKDYVEANYVRFFQRLEEIESRHLRIGLRCTEVASDTLETNIYDLDYDQRSDEIVRPQPDPLAPVRYACEFWIEHLCLFHEKAVECSHDHFSNDGPVLEFLHEHFLHWLEALLLLGNLALSIPLVAQLLRTVQRFDGECRLATFLGDAEIFIRRHRALIELHPRQLYSSALLFTPAECQVVKSQWRHLEKWIGSVSGTRTKGDAWRNVLHSGSKPARFWSLAFSSDNKLLASFSPDLSYVRGTVWIWELAFGSVVDTILVPVGPPDTIAFSPNNECIALAGNEIVLCEISSGNYSEAPNLEFEFVKQMKFSRNGNIIVVVAENKEEYLVAVWDTRANATRVIKEAFFNNRGIAFEPDKLVLLATDEGQNMCLGSRISSIDIESGVHLCALSETDDVGRTFAFSDNTIVILQRREYGERISVLHASKGADLPGLSVLEDVPGYLSKLTFTQEQKFVAAVVRQHEKRLSSIYIWDVANGKGRHIINLPSNTTTEILLSPNGEALACILDHGLIYILDIETLVTQRPSNPGPFSLMVISPSGKLLVAESDGKLVVWDTCNQEEAYVFNGDNLVASAVFTHDDSKLAWISANKVMLSEIPSSGSIQSLKHSGSAKCITFSSDAKLIVCGVELRNGSGEVSFWDTNTRECTRTFPTCGPVECIALSDDGKTIAVLYNDRERRTGQLWLRDLETGRTQTLEHLWGSTSIVISSDGSLVGLAAKDILLGGNYLGLYEADTGKLLGTGSILRGSVACSALDGSHLTTNRGCVPLHTFTHSSSDDPTPKTSSCSELYVSDGWVSLGGRRRLEIPPTYRPPCVAVSGNLVVLGYDSGELMWLRFNCGNS